MLTSDELKLHLRQFTGTDNWYKHAINQTILYTDGVRFFAQNAKAYWLLDILATELNDIRKTEEFMGIKLEVRSDSTARLLVDDGNDNILHRKDIELTNCPAGKWVFYMTTQNSKNTAISVIMLPSEY